MLRNGSFLSRYLQLKFEIAAALASTEPADKIEPEKIHLGSTNISVCPSVYLSLCLHYIDITITIV
jgi:hypothetical protein